MIEKDRIIASAGLDIHYQFSTVALCNAQGQVVRACRFCGIAAGSACRCCVAGVRQARILPYSRHAEPVP